MITKGELHSRFKDASWYNLMSEKDILVGGLGGIGSWLSLFLTRAGASSVVGYDNDTFEPHNMSGQFVNTMHTKGSTKASALQDLITKFTNTRNFVGYHRRFSYASNYATIMCSCFDNMEARRAMFDTWKNKVVNSYDHSLFIDGRLLMEQMEIYCVTKDNYEKFESEFLPTDDEIPDETCTLKQTTHSAAMIASHMTGFITNFLSNVVNENSVFRVPLKWTYFIPLDMTQSDYDATKKA